MVKFNIIGYGFLGMSDPTGVAFKASNPFYRFCDISLGRSTEFSVPATAYNRHLLQFGEDPVEYGEMMRRTFPAQMVYDGGVSDGILAVTGYASEAFSCVFTIGGTEWIENFNNKKLKDIPLLTPVTIPWTSASVGASDSDNTVQMVPYDRDVVGAALPAPCLNIRNYLGALLGPMGIGQGFNPGFENYWLVSASMVGGDEENITITSTAANDMTVTGDSLGMLSVEDISVEWGTVKLWSGGVIGGGSFSAKGLKAVRAVKLALATSGNPNCYVIKWSAKMSRYEAIAGPGLNGVTIELKKDDIVFFAATPVRWNGYQDTYHPLSITATLTPQESNMQQGDTWNLALNAPDMTLFELLKSVALATGNDVVVIPSDVAVIPSGYGTPTMKTLDKVISVDSVRRNVDAWGSNTKKKTVRFDSEYYVTEPLSSVYEIDNNNLDGEDEVRSAFSEGNVGTHGVEIDDHDGAKFTAKKWTIAYAENGDKWLRRVSAPSSVACSDIATESTCVRVKVQASVADFFDLLDIMTGGLSRVFVWRGCSYVWTDADWSEGVMGLTLQRVSQLQS